jgi:hypothetical protein
VKKNCLIFVGLLIVGVLLAGCGGGSSTNTYGKGEGGPGPEPGTTTTAVDPKVQQCRDNITNIYSAVVDYKMRNSGIVPRDMSWLVGLLNPVPVEPFGGTYALTEDPDAPIGVTVTCSLGHEKY